MPGPRSEDARPSNNDGASVFPYSSAVADVEGTANLLSVPIASKHVRTESVSSDATINSTWSASSYPATPASDFHEPDSVDTQRLLEVDPGVAGKEGVFAFTAKQLEALHESRDLGLLKAMGGLEGFCLGLRTDLDTGLSPQEDRFDVRVTLDLVQRRLQSSDDHRTDLIDLEPGTVPRTNAERSSAPRRFSISSRLRPHKPSKFTDRKNTFGENKLLPRKQKTLLSLMWSVLQDRVLVSCLSCYSI